MMGRLVWLPLRCTRRHRTDHLLASLPHDLRDDATCTTRRRSSTSFEANWETLARLVFRWSKPLDLDMCPSPCSSCRFCGTADNHSPLDFEAQTKKPSWWFWGPNHQTTAVGFEAQIGKPDDLGFEAQPRNSRSSSPYAWCRSHTMSPDLPIVRPSSIWPMLDHPWSSAPGLLLLPRSSSLSIVSHLSPTHHETNKHDSPYEQIGVKEPKYPGFEFKLLQVNDSSQSKQGTNHMISQFLIYL
jgi:hypothetical protein